MTSTAGSRDFDQVPSIADGRDRAAIATMASRAFDRANEVRAREPYRIGGQLNLARFGPVLTAISWATVLRHLDRTGEDIFDSGRFDEPRLSELYAGVGGLRVLFGRAPFTFYPVQTPWIRRLGLALYLLVMTAGLTSTISGWLPVPGIARFLISLIVVAASTALGQVAGRWAGTRIGALLAPWITRLMSGPGTPDDVKDAL